MAVTENQISPLLELVKIEGKGRGLVASQPLKGGQIVLRDSPIYAYFVSPLKHQQQLLEEESDISSYTRCCAHCYRHLLVAEETTLITCPSCSHPQDAAFCSSRCLSLALSSTHTPWVCRTLSYLRNCPLLVDHQIEARCLVAVFNLAMVSPSAFRTFLTLDGCGDRDRKRYFDPAISLHSVFSRVPFPEGSSFSVPSVELMADILAKDWRNCFCLMGPFSEENKGKRHVRAYGLYLNASFSNHSCLPNACHFDYLDSTTDNRNTDLVIRVTKDVPRGEEICISYLRVNTSHSERQKRLMDYYTFACSCDRCKVEGKLGGGDDDFGFLDSHLKRFMCERETCRGILAPLPPSDDGNRSEFMECSFCGNLTKRTDEA